MTWRQKTEAEKAIAFEAIRPRLPDAWTLLEIVESANPPDEHDDPSSRAALPGTTSTSMPGTAGR